MNPGPSRTVVKLPAFLRHTLICGGDRGLRGAKGENGSAGATGAIGAPGATGATGAAGTNGTNGANGTNGSPGLRGADGAPGADGLVGVVGPTGPVGPAATRTYAYIYDLAGQSVVVDAPVVFDTNGATTSDITHTAGTSSIAIATGGIYKLSFSVSSINANQMAVFVGATQVGGGTYGSSDVNQQTNGQMIIAISAGDVLTLRNHTSNGTIVLNNHTGGGIGTSAVDASVLIERLG
jgi:collagen type I alpha